MKKKRFRRLSHTIYECKYHIVFCPKYRYKVLKGEVAESVRQNIYELCRRKDGVEVLELNIQLDHVHIIIWIPPKYSISNMMGYLKGKVASKVFEKHPYLRKRYWGMHLWSRGYCVSTIGLDEEKIRKYVIHQEKEEKKEELVQQKLFN